MNNHQPPIVLDVQRGDKPKHRDDSYVEVFAGGGVAMVGTDAISLYRAQLLLSHIKLYLKTGIIPTRGVTGPKMLVLAMSITKNEYKGNGKYDRALVDLRNWVETMKAAMPIMENGKQVG